MREQNAELAVAASDGQSHPVIGLWSVALREQLRHALVVEDIRKIDRWTARYRLATVTWPTTPLDPFFNANTMDDIAEADRLAALDGGPALRRIPDANRSLRTGLTPTATTEWRGSTRCAEISDDRVSLGSSGLSRPDDYFRPGYRGCSCRTSDTLPGGRPAAPLSSTSPQKQRPCHPQPYARSTRPNSAARQITPPMARSRRRSHRPSRYRSCR